MTAFNQACDETVEVSDDLVVANPAIAVADTPRSQGSMLLRLLRRPLRYVTFELPPHYGYLEPGDYVWSGHELLPEGPEGYEPWELVPLMVVEVHDPLSEAKLTVKCVDLREVWATWWSPLQTEIGMTDDLNGIAILDQGGGWETVRDQVGYGIRPPGNDAWQEVLASQPIVDAHGLLCEGGGDTNHLLNSTFSEGSGDTFTSWTKVTSGAAIAVQWQLYTLIDANGFRRAAVLRTEAAGEASYLHQTVNSMENRSFVVRVFFKDGGAFDRMGLRIQRSDTSEYFRDSDGTWQAGTQTISLTPASGVIDTVRYVTKLITTTSGGTVNLTISAGHFSAVANETQISQLQGVELIEVPLGFRYFGFRSPLPTKAAAVTRVRNVTSIVNDTGVRVLSPTRGFVKVAVRPHWSHSDLGNSVAKHAWAAEFDGAGGSEYLRLLYERIDASTGEWRFELGSGAGNDEAVLEVTGAALPTAETETVVICRWTSPSDDEHGVAGQVLDVWVDGVRGTSSGTGLTPAAASAECGVTLGSLEDLADLHDHFDGYLRLLTIGDHCPREAELLRI